ncbi:MAG: hypothetical protein LBT53_07655 [Puniceicoccales bacterium]|jgi:hypothetical protein|nr:hypothetical protein [Puniceicoccales bacterium]
MRPLFDTLSNNLRYVSVLLAGTAIGGKVLFADNAIMTVFALGFLGIAAMLFVYDLVRSSKQKKAEKSLADQLSGNSGATPGGISEAARRAQLDDLRRAFLNGLAQFRTAGKDLYKLPWYMVVGEPGSGKTEAIRRCNIGFPSGLQNEMSGTGGTINMNWWFANQAVILDTAGKLLFEETPAGTTTEWTEFLNLLRKNRPDCPVNGVLLVIPADTLLRDTADTIAKKAGKIAEQLDRIQRSLDVRFPVFVLVTKCDLLNGFREFCADIKDPKLQHQMTGWSNPDGLDKPFNPEGVDEHFQTLRDTISRRRLGLMLDPAARGEGTRRADEVDTLFSLPQSIAALAPRLRLYLEKVFTVGEWSAKPLFLRGIYLTSAITDGKALDMEIANALGVTPDSLPEGRIFERERSFFLRDLFLEKIFQEKGLVTRAVNTGKQLLRRRIILGTAGGVSFSLVVGLSVWGAFTVQESVGMERAYWQAAATGWNPKTHTWNPIVIPEYRGASKYIYNGSTPISVDGESVPLAEFHTRLQSIVTRDISVPVVYQPLNLLVAPNTSRRKAQRILFDTSVTRPLIDAARIRVADVETPWTPRDTAALSTLIQLEGIIHYPSVPGYKVEFTPNAFVPTLLGLWVREDAAKASAMLDAVFQWTQYSESGAGKSVWPEKSLSNGATLSQNKPVAAGIDRFAASKSELLLAQGADARQIKTVADAAYAWQKAETEFLNFTRRDKSTPGWLDAAQKSWPAVVAAAQRLDTAVEVAQGKDILPKEKISLAVACKKYLEAAAAGMTAELAPLRSVISKFRPPALLDKAASAAQDSVLNKISGASPAATNLAADAAKKALAAKRANFSPFFPMQQEISARLDELDQKTASLAGSALGEAAATEIAKLDTNYFAASYDKPVYRVRFNGYADAMRLFRTAAELAPELSPRLIGNLSDALRDSESAASNLAARAAGYSDSLMHEYRESTKNLSTLGKTAAAGAIFELYSQTLGDMLLKDAAFPVILDSPNPPMTPETLKRLAGNLRGAASDLASNAAGVPPRQRETFDLSSARVTAVTAVVKALIRENGELATVKILVPDLSDQQTVLARAGVENFANSFAGNEWGTLRLGGKTSRAHRQAASPGFKPDELLVAKSADKLPTLELFKGADALPKPDAILTFETAWTPFVLLSAPRSGALRKGDGETWQATISIKEPPPVGPPANGEKKTDTEKSASEKTAATTSAGKTAAEKNLVLQTFLLTLQFQFDAPLPELEKWPTLKNLKLTK